MKLWSLRERELWMNEAERREEGYFYIQVFWDCGVVTCQQFFFYKKKGSLFSGDGIIYSILHRLSFLPSPGGNTLFARGETLGTE